MGCGASSEAADVQADSGAAGQSDAKKQERDIGKQNQPKSKTPKHPLDSWPVNFEGIPLFRSYFFEHEKYERYHIYLKGVRPSKSSSEATDTIANQSWLSFDMKADPYLVMKTFGDDTGSTDYFPIGIHRFRTLKNNPTPLWEEKCVLIAKKDGTKGIHMELFDDDLGKDELMYSVDINRSDLPKAEPLDSANWEELVLPVADDGRLKGMEIVLYVRVSNCDQRVVSKESTDALYKSTKSRTYKEVTFAGKSGKPEDKALLQCWQHSSPPKTAVLWIPGRGDCFMHPHVASRLFFDNDCDLYVLNYRMTGHCRKQGWVEDPNLNSHNFAGDFDIYQEDVEHAVGFIQKHRKYDKLLGYAHSTGGLILINYLMERGDEVFDGFVFNSPFLDWGHVGGDLMEFVLENLVEKLEGLGVVSNETLLNAKTTPEPLKDTPLIYRDKEVVLNDWGTRIWSLYYYEWETRPIYSVPLTVGFANGATKAMKALEDLHKEKRAATTKPFLMITARGDHVLKAPETLSRADWIGPAGVEVELNDNTHDVFLSGDKNDNDMALDMVAVWMKNKGFTE